MTTHYRTPAAEQAAIHAAVCRARRQGLCCSVCRELDARAASSSAVRLAVAA